MPRSTACGSTVSALPLQTGNSVSEPVYTQADARALMVGAALEALKRHAATHPLPTVLTLEDAASILKVSPRTVRRRFKVRSGTVPYAAVLEALAAK